MLPPAWEDATDGMTTALHITVMPVEVAMSDSQRQAREKRGRRTAPAMMNSVHYIRREMKWQGGREGRREGGREAASVG